MTCKFFAFLFRRMGKQKTERDAFFKYKSLAQVAPLLILISLLRTNRRDFKDIQPGNFLILSFFQGLNKTFYKIKRFLDFN